MNKPLLSFLLSSLLSVPMWGLAADLQCAGVFNEIAPQSAAQILNTEMTEKYPKLTFVNRDPDLFIKEMHSRFETKKKADPKHAYEFDYSELGMPLVKDTASGLDGKITEITKNLAALEQKRESRNLITKMISLDQFKRAEMRVALEYLRDLREEAEIYLQDGKVSYKDIVEFSYFYSRAIGHFDTRPQGPILRLFMFIDRSINGYQQLSISREYDLYKKRAFKVFQRRSVTKNFRSAEVPFRNLFKADHLETIWVPTNEAVSRDIFMRLMSKNINLIGVTVEPILADGVLRPGGDFFNHDIRHESFKYYERGVYIERHGLKEAQIQALSRKSEEWLLQYRAELAKVKDTDLHNAIDHLAFNFHHDAGFPFIPSVYLHRVKDSAARNLYFMEKWSGQGVDFKNPLKNLDRADQWLIEFWKVRLDEETAILMNEIN
jgi:hypothetical protein